MDMSKAHDVGAEISRRLKEKNITQLACADALGWPSSRINNYCKGHREADYASLEAIATYLGCTPNDLFGIRSAVNRDLFNDIVAAVAKFLADYQRDIAPDRRGALYWAIYDAAIAEPETMTDENGKIRPAFLNGMMKAALSL